MGKRKMKRKELTRLKQKSFTHFVNLREREREIVNLVILVFHKAYTSRDNHMRQYQ